MLVKLIQFYFIKHNSFFFIENHPKKDLQREKVNTSELFLWAKHTYGTTKFVLSIEIQLVELKGKLLK